MKQKHYLILVAIFLITLAARLYISFQSPEFSSDQSYFVLRQVEQITYTGTPLYNDDLSYGGRTFIFPPIFYYLLAFFNLFLPLTIVAKVIPNILASLLVIIVFMIAKEITRNDNVALFSAFISGFIPIYFVETVNTVSLYSLAIPLIFATIYYLIKMQSEKKYALHVVLLIGLMSRVHASIFIVLIGLLFYLLIMKLEKMKVSTSEIEIILFSVFIIFWSQFILFKEAFLIHGTSIIWQNTPLIYLSSEFAKFSLASAIYAIGVIPLFFGFYVVFKRLFQKKKKQDYLLISFTVSILLILLLRFISIKPGLMFLGVLLVLLFAIYCKSFLVYMTKTKFYKSKYLLTVLLVGIFIFNSIIPSFDLGLRSLKESPTESDIEAFNWLKNNTPETSTILTTLREGHALTYFTNRKNVIDDNFILIENIDQRLEDIDRIYSTVFLTDAIPLLNKYSVDYIILTNKARFYYNIKDIVYTEDKKCFSEVYNSDDIKIYESKCVIKIV